MEQVVDGLRLEDFLSPEISRVLQDPKSDTFSSLDQQSLTTTSNPGPSQEITDRFGTITEEEIHDAIEKRVPANTKKSTGWGYSVWLEWCKARNIDQNILTMDEKKLNEVMARFVHEVRRKDGNEYPPSSLICIVSAVQRYLRENGRPAVCFYDDKNSTYDMLRKSLDAKLKLLTSKGIGSQPKQAQPISPEMENKLWQKKIFSRETGEALTNIVFWYSSKMFGLRAADEHRELEVSQFSIATDENGKFIRFLGRTCKNWQGGLHQRNIKPKDLKIYAKPELGERCAVSIFQYYLDLIPSVGRFYRRPLTGSPARYSAQVIGKNKLSLIVRKFCDKAGFKGTYTNHSGKVTCATELFNNNIDEQLIMKQTGHRSQDAVRKYKRPSVQHDIQVSDILQPPVPKKFATSESQKILQKENVPTTAVISSSTLCPAITSTAAPPMFTFNVNGNAPQNIYINYM